MLFRSLPVSFYPSLFVAVDATNAPRADVQPGNHKSLQAGPGWKELEIGSFVNSGSAPLDVRYAYFWVASLPKGLLKIDTITLVN